MNEEYVRGYLAGLWAYAWWKDGVAYVGTTGTTFEDAAKRFLAENGLLPDPAAYGYGRSA